jgi:hypothetical protein
MAPAYGSWYKASEETVILADTLTPITGSVRATTGAAYVELEVTGAVTVDAFMSYSFDGVKFFPANLLEFQGVASGSTVGGLLPAERRPPIFKLSGNGVGAGSTVIVRVFYAVNPLTPPNGQ